MTSHWLLYVSLLCACGARPAPQATDTGPDADAGDDGARERCDRISPEPGPLRSFYESNPTYEDSGLVARAWESAHRQVTDGRTDGLLPCVEEIRNYPSALSIIIIQGDELLIEQYFNGGRVDAANNVHSSSKSILGALIGIALAEGLLESVDQRIVELLPESLDISRDSRLETLTIDHLLTMTSGFLWVEDQTEYRIIEEERDWVTAILGLPLQAAPGERFNYSTGNTHVLSAVLTTVTDGDTCTFAHRTLFDPLGVDVEHWRRDPMGIFSGGCNLYMTPRELALFGVLYLRGGELNGQQILSPDWIEASLTEHARVDGEYGYGRLWWTRELGGHQVWMAWGYGGQMIYLVRDLDVLITTTTNTRDFEREISFQDEVGACIIPVFE